MLDETSFGILDALSRDVGRPVSIRRLTGEIRDLNHRAHYANVYRRVQVLAGLGILGLSDAGRARLVSLNLGSELALDFLGQLELVREAYFLMAHPEFGPLLSGLDAVLRSTDGAGPVELVEADRNARLNRAELLLLRSRRSPGGLDAQREVLAALEDLGRSRGIRVDALLLREDGWIQRLASSARDPVQDMAADAIAVRDPQGLWARLADATARGLSLRFERPALRLDRLPERDVEHSLARFGYREFGTTAVAGTDLALETTVVAVLLRGDARRIAAIPGILAEHPPDYALLTFLARKHGSADRLAGLLRSEPLQSDPTARAAADLLEGLRSPGAPRRTGGRERTVEARGPR